MPNPIIVNAVGSCGRRLVRTVLLAFLIIAGLALPDVLGAQSTAPIAANEEIAWATLVMNLVGGLALFLFGMDQMSDGLKAAAGDGLTRILAKLTKNRFMGAATGAFVTAVLNSSSVTTVLIVGFITAGVMTLSQSIGVIMGANVGSTFTAQIIAFNVTQYSLLMVAIGFAMIFSAKRDKVKSTGQMIMGLGLVFFGVGIMGDAMQPLRTYQPFLDLMLRMENPILGILIGALFTGLVQSSAATTGIAIVMAADGLITLDAGIALALGSNIGTCVTALMASIGKPVEAVRAAVAHTLFNVAGVLLWVFFIDKLAAIVVDISPAAPGLEGRALAAATVPRQIANAHTVFNIANTALLIGFTGTLAKLVERIIPDHAKAVTRIVEPRYLDDSLLEAPSAALELVRRELGHLGEITQEMMTLVRIAVRAGDRASLSAIATQDDKAAVLHQLIVDYLGRIRQNAITGDQREILVRLLRGADELERVSDVIEQDMVSVGHRVLDLDFPWAETQGPYADLVDRTLELLGRATHAVVEEDENAAAEVLAANDEINRHVSDALGEQMKRVDPADPRQLDIFQTSGEIVDAFKHIYSISKRLARLVAPQVVLAS